MLYCQVQQGVMVFGVPGGLRAGDGLDRVGGSHDGLEPIQLLLQRFEDLRNEVQLRVRAVLPNKQHSLDLTFSKSFG